MNLASKYRPQTFEEVAGQQTTIKILQTLINNKKFKNVMLFSGQSGAGKTTLARIIAKEINGNLDGVIELDCASQNSVDNVRAIIEDANKRSITGDYKIFILDECHMFTSAAWNAFLKLLEECPKYTILIFCTTDEQKIPLTVRNRMQRYPISKVETAEIKNRLEYICKAEGFTNYEVACDMISKMSNGSLREAITTLEKCTDFSIDLSLTNIKPILGDLSYESMFKLTWALTNKKEDQLFEIIETLDNNGADLKRFIEIYTSFILDLIKYILFKEISVTSIPNYLATTDNPVVQTTINIENNKHYFNTLIENLLELTLNLKYDTSCKTTILATFIRFMRKN